MRNTIKTSQHEFEKWLRKELCWRLNLSKSKQVAIDEIFYGFASYVEPLAKVAPVEFEQFFNELQKRIRKTSNWKCPKTHMIVPAIGVDEDENVHIGKFPNGNSVYKIVPKS